MMGRASRYLQWQDILYYQRLGMRLYDFGGWYHGHADADLLRINNFRHSSAGRSYAVSIVPKQHRGADGQSCPRRHSVGAEDRLRRPATTGR
jgi:hypothetical protein